MIAGLSDRLRSARITKHYSQKQVSNYLGISRENISNYEKQGVSPSAETLMKLAVLYDVSSDFLLGIERESTIFIDGLNDYQKNVLQMVANEFKEKNRYE